MALGGGRGMTVLSVETSGNDNMSKYREVGRERRTQTNIREDQRDIATIEFEIAAFW